MKVSRQSLVEGCILLDDIYSMSPNPIFTKKTVITAHHLEVLKAFLVDEVTVHDYLANGLPFTPLTQLKEEKKQLGSSNAQNQSNLLSSYYETVKRYKEQFQQWQNGANVNLLGLKAIMHSLINSYSKHPNDLFRLHEKTTQEEYMFHHGVTVGLVAAYLAQKMNYPKQDCQEIGLTGLLMDCGMSKVPTHYLVKTIDLNPETAQQLAKHPVMGYQMLKKEDQISEGILLAVLQHHEREDGTGYPLGIKADQIHYYSKIIMVVDAYHAMVSNRHYRERISPFTALEILNQDKLKFNYKVVSTLIEEIMYQFLGSQVLLSDGRQGEVIFIPTGTPTRPIIRLEDGQTILLSQSHSLLIKQLI